MSKNFKELIEALPLERQERIKEKTAALLKEINEAEEALKSGVVSIPEFIDSDELAVWLKANAPLIAS